MFRILRASQQLRRAAKDFPKKETLTAIYNRLKEACEGAGRTISDTDRAVFIGETIQYATGAERSALIEELKSVSGGVEFSRPLNNALLNIGNTGDVAGAEAVYAISKEVCSRLNESAHSQGLVAAYSQSGEFEKMSTHLKSLTSADGRPRQPSTAETQAAIWHYATEGEDKDFDAALKALTTAVGEGTARETASRFSELVRFHRSIRANDEKSVLDSLSVIIGNHWKVPLPLQEAFVEYFISTQGVEVARNHYKRLYAACKLKSYPHTIQRLLYPETAAVFNRILNRRLNDLQSYHTTADSVELVHYYLEEGPSDFVNQRLIAQILSNVARYEDEETFNLIYNKTVEKLRKLNIKPNDQLRGAIRELKMNQGSILELAQLTDGLDDGERLPVLLRASLYSQKNHMHRQVLDKIFTVQYRFQKPIVSLDEFIEVLAYYHSDPQAMLELIERAGELKLEEHKGKLYIELLKSQLDGEDVDAALSTFETVRQQLPDPVDVVPVYESVFTHLDNSTKDYSEAIKTIKDSFLSYFRPHSTPVINRIINKYGDDIDARNFDIKRVAMTSESPSDLLDYIEELEKDEGFVPTVDTHDIVLQMYSRKQPENFYTYYKQMWVEGDLPHTNQTYHNLVYFAINQSKPSQVVTSMMQMREDNFIPSQDLIRRILEFKVDGKRDF